MTAPARRSPRGHPRAVVTALVVGLLGLQLAAAAPAPGQVATNAISVDLPTTAEGDVGFNALTFTITLTRVPGNNDPVTVEYQTTMTGTARANQDFVFRRGTASFTGAKTTERVTLDVLGDRTDEADETVRFELLNPDNAELATDPLPTTGEITDDDDEPELSVGSVSVDEGNAGDTQARFAVTLSAPSGRQVTVAYATADGTAKAGDGDYTPTSGNLMFEAGELTEVVPVPVADDVLDEVDVTFTLSLSGEVNAGVRVRTGTGTILDDDAEPSVSIDDPVTSGESGTADFTVSLSAPSGREVRVRATTSDLTARAGSDGDYRQTDQDVIFGAGDRTKTFSVSLLDDTVDEPNELFAVDLSSPQNTAITKPRGTATITDDDAGPDEEDTETFTVQLSNPTNAILAKGSGVGSISDDDNPPVISVDDLELDEGNSGTSNGNVVVRLNVPSGRVVTVNYTTEPDGVPATADATADEDYTAPPNGTLRFEPGQMVKRVPVSATGDGHYEGDEFFVLRLTPPMNATLGANPGEVVISDDDPAPVLTIADARVVEPDGSTEVGIVFVVSLSEESGRDAFADVATLDGTAVDLGNDPGENDYDLPTISPVQIPKGDKIGFVTATVNGDAEDEPDETFDVILSNPVDATFPDEAPEESATGTILDNDGPPSLSVSPKTVNEGDTDSTASVTVTLLPAANGDVTVNYLGESLADQAQSPAGYSVTAGTLTFHPGETKKEVPVQIVGDLVDERDEVFNVKLSNVSGPPSGDPAVIGKDTAPVTIVDDDGPSISVADLSVAEGGPGTTTPAAFVVSLSAASPQPVSVRYATSGDTANSPSDYTATSGSLNFAPGEKQKTVNVPIVGDDFDEADEHFTLGLSSPVNGSIGQAVGRARIVDDDQPTVSFSAALVVGGAASVVEGDFGGVMTFTLTLNAPTGRESSLAYATMNGMALADGDYLPVSGRVTFAPGETSKTVAVAIVGDDRDEVDETIRLRLSDPVNVTLPGTDAVATILDDDEQGNVLVATDGGIFTFGDAGFHGSTGSMRLNQPIVGMASHPSGRGYWLVAADGGIFTLGEAGFHGSTGSMRLNRPIVGMAATPTGEGYWLAASDGGIFAFGDARFRGSTGGRRLNRPIVGMAARPSGEGYWLVASDGGVFAFNAPFKGSMGAITLNKPIVGMAAHPSGDGYWLVASDGGVFAFNAPFKGSTGSITLNKPIVGMAPTPSGDGYWLVASDGGIFAFPDAAFLGSTGAMRLNQPVVAMADL